MKTLKKAIHLFNASAKERRAFTAFSLPVQFLLSCLEYLIYTGMIYAVFQALSTGNMKGLVATALLCMGVCALYLGLCYFNNVYIDMNAFWIISYAEVRAMRRIHLLNSGAVPARQTEEEVLNTARQGSNALALYFGTYVKILTGLAVLACLVLYGLGNSVYILIVLGVTVAMTIGGLILSKRVMEKTEEIRQDALADCERSSGLAVQGIYMRCFGQEPVAEEYEQFCIDRDTSWNILWKQEKGTGFIRSFQEFIAVILKGGLGTMCYPDYESGRMSYNEIGTALDSYDRIRQIIARQVYPFQQAARAKVAIGRLDGWYQLPVSVKGGACAEIRAENLSVEADGRQILKGINFCIREGEHVALIGNNGSGKTTLLRCLLGLLPFQEGKILYDGENLRELSYGQRRSFFSWIPNRASLFEGSADYNIEMNCETGEGEKKTALYEAFAFHKSKEENVLNYSDGEQQRVNIIRGMCHKAGWLIADEPTARLQRSLSRRAMEEILNNVEGCLVVTHERDQWELFDRLLVLQNGELIYDGVPNGYQFSQ